MWNFELVDYMQFIIDIAFIEKLKLSISHLFNQTISILKISDLLYCKIQQVEKKTITFSFLWS